MCDKCKGTGEVEGNIEGFTVKVACDCDAGKIMKKMHELKHDLIEIKALCKDLLKGADRCMGPPLYVVQPFFNTVKKHMSTISKYNLTEDL